MARHDSISQECDAEITRLLLANVSIRAVARACGVSESAVARRRGRLRKAGAPFERCGCGRIGSHSGMCSHRVGRFSADPNPKRGKFDRSVHGHTYRHHVRKAAEISPPDISNPSDLFAYFDAIVPRTFPNEVREDVRQDMLVDALQGALSVLEAAAKLPMYARRAFDSSAHSPMHRDQGEDAISLANVPAAAPYEMTDEEQEEYVTNIESIRTRRLAGFTRRRVIE